MAQAAPDDLSRIRHSAAHIMAQAVSELFPGAKLAVGPAIEHGFYYDFELPRPLVPTDLEEIERRMRRIIAEDHAFTYRVVNPEEARVLFADQPYKLQLIADLVGSNDGSEDEGIPPLSTYRQDGFEDLCRGPHVERTSQVPSDGFKLLSSSGAYWRGDERNPMLQRIYGTAWQTKDELDHHLWRIEEGRQRDHRRLGRELDLFSVSSEVGSGLILWHPKGAMVRVIAEDFCRAAHLQSGYEWVFSPHIGRAQLWRTSGHLEFYRDTMYAPLEIDGEEYFLKPVNCPFHIQIFSSRVRSYRELPRRYAEFGTVYRYERSGELHGLARVRGFTQDDAHIFCRPDQVEEEILRALRFSLFILRAFGLADFHAYLSTRPEKFAGAIEDWERATDALRAAIDAEAIPFSVDEGGGAFYGPKIDLKVRDALGREWQLSTIQFDFNLPEQFDLQYVGEDNEPHRPYMVHRALLGSMERFFAVLIEHFGGAFPLWLAPVQAVVIPVSTKRHLEYGRAVTEQLQAAGIRVELDVRNERMQARIRDAQLQKVPYMLIVGDREQTSAAVSLRSRSGEEQHGMPLDAFISRIAEEVAAHHDHELRAYKTTVL
jgi:threonyl-tRNA synthetase